MKATDQNLILYRVSFTDGTIEKTYARSAANAWWIAGQLWPSKEITGLQVLEAKNVDRLVT